MYNPSSALMDFMLLANSEIHIKPTHLQHKHTIYSAHLHELYVCVSVFVCAKKEEADLLLPCLSLCVLCCGVCMRMRLEYV